MTQKKIVIQSYRTSVFDLILNDHRYLKECIKTLTDINTDKNKKFKIANDFLEALEKHSDSEIKAFYSTAEGNEELHFNILEAQIEHKKIDQSVKKMKRQLSKVRSLKVEVEAELSALIELVSLHLFEEESEILPRMQQAFTDEALEEMGVEFLKIRKRSSKKSLGLHEIF